MVLPQNQKPEMTYGQQIVRVDFSANSDVEKMKRDFAHLIDNARDWTPGSCSVTPDNVMRMMGHKARAIADLETACMYMVKAMTTATEPLPEGFLGHGQPL